MKAIAEIMIPIVQITKIITTQQNIGEYKFIEYYIYKIVRSAN